MSDAGWMRGVEWLAAAATDPRACKRDWDQGNGVALLRAGRFWDVLSVPDRLGLLTLDLLWQPSLPVPGPTLVDTAAHRVGFFLPPDPDSRWIGAGVRHARRGAWVAVPPPYRPARSLEWLVPPDGSGALHRPSTLELALRQANGSLAVWTPSSRRGAELPQPGT
ncbi:hypothetical protein ABZ722_24795 [Streptomyces longwoodensis]|uniref:DNA primase/polymerase bifunctional N-terminal domain-containing protein n=1 Tax=Streptomyces lasalocidi TaxID=324833 RepID=A0A4U5WBP7_STRLS|nr:MULTISPECIES: hypothetical protein [Streptomyces]MCX5000123.1 hypothetical protein [Streptomyces longwoodensis]TKS99154.1 hypothetical protein E4U91_02840 [Streptomyces lasalocidi]WTI48838.1 hypothetical protein OG547_32115 [Streptomyces longwoodensis]WUC75109.1 hypothetical protein OG416_32085 [Streptomyces longwoodensis]